MKPLKLVTNDTGLMPYSKVITKRRERTLLKSAELCNGKPLKDIGNGYFYYGLHRYPEHWVLREWAPNADMIYLVGDFSDWQAQDQFRMERLSNGNWEIVLPPHLLKHGDLYKLLVEWHGGSGERIPAYCRRVVQDDHSKIFSAQVWLPKQAYVWRHTPPAVATEPLIYEAHVGMSSEKHKVACFNDFRTQVLPYIAEAGYNTIQLMAIQEHPYYGSFGYQVSNFFAVSSRFGTPEELKQLIDDAHGLGIAVVMDIVHSHSVSNELEGLSRLDGSTDLYFHAGERGNHPAWGSRCFDYGKNEVLSFLLSNCKYWLEEFRFDGFRFDGVTSMIYLDHGLEKDFTSYADYYDGKQDEDALTYLSLANQLIHELKPDAITIAEDVSGLPGLAAPLADGGIGFDFRMAMGVADFWIKMIKEKEDENWRVGDMFYELTNKRKDEKTISYAESHDQAMVGDQTIIFRLLDKEMYFSMDMQKPNLIVDRGIALHKMIRLLTISTAGNAYLNFMGNEFGHPEWIDFPREGNGWSYQYARRQWSLRTDPKLRYRFLAEFDKAMIALVRKENILKHLPYAIVQDNEDQMLVFKRGNVVFLFNFNPQKSFFDYGFRIDKGSYRIVLSSDNARFNGFNRIDETIVYPTSEVNREHWLKVYLPARTALVLKKME